MGPDGTPGNATSSNPVISADGRVVAFESAATNLVAGGDPNGGAHDIYVIALDTGVIARVSLDDRSRPSPLGFSVSPTISADGRYVAFTSSAMLDGSLPTPDRSANPQPVLPSTQVFVRDLRARCHGTGQRCPRMADGLMGPATFPPSAVTVDGSRSCRMRRDLAAGDRNDVSDVYLRDLVTSTTTAREWSRWPRRGWREHEPGAVSHRPLRCLPIRSVRPGLPSTLQAGRRGRQPRLGRVCLRPGFRPGRARQRRPGWRLDGVERPARNRSVGPPGGVFLAPSD